MKKMIKRTAAALLTMALFGAAMPFEAGTFALPQIALTAKAAAASTAVLDEATRTLTLSGNVTVDDVQAFANDERVYSVVAEPGTVFPTYCTGMFQNFKYVHDIDLYYADTTYVESMRAMFRGCENLYSLDVSTFNTSRVTDMAEMFYGCKEIESLGLQSFNTVFVGNLSGMFMSCRSLMKIYVSDQWVVYANLLPYGCGEDVFSGCVKLIGGNGTTYSNYATTANWARIDTEGFPGYLTRCSTALLDTHTGTLTLSGNVNLLDVRAYPNNAKVTSVVAAPGTVFPEDCTCMFGGFYYTKSFDLKEADVSQVTTMNLMFKECSACTNFDLTGWDTSHVTDMSYMFYKCSSLSDTYYIRDIKGWNTDSVTTMERMFANCTKLQFISLGSDRYEYDPYDDAWKTDSVMNYSRMFYGLNAISRIQIYNFALKSDAVTSEMFSGCSTLDTLCFFRNFEVKSDMCLDNTYGWVNYDGIKSSGDGSFAVIPAQPDRLSICYNLGSFAKIDLKNLHKNNLAMVVNRPYAGNTGQTLITYYTNSAFTLDRAYCGWYDVDRDCFMTEDDTFQPDHAYIYRVRLKPDRFYLFENPTAEELAQLHITDFNNGELEYLDVEAAHLNEDGTLDFYACLKPTCTYNGTDFNIAQKTNVSAFYPPEGSVYVHSGFQSYGLIYAYKLPKMYKTAMIETDSILLTMLGGSLMSSAYQGYMGIDGYEVSIDGENYVSMESMNGKAFEGLTPGTDYTFCVRLKGETEPFYTETIRTESTLAITKQPENASGCIGDQVQFTVEATGDNLIYQWQYYNTETKKWENTGLAGNKTPKLTVSVLANRNGMKYHCIVKDSTGTKLTSNAATLTVNPKITAQPVDASGCVGDKVQFTVEATGIGLIYQWQYYNTETKKWENTGLAGNKTPTLTVSVLANRNGMKYHCIVKDTNGTKVTSAAVTLKVNPKITAHPVDAEGCIGDKAQFTVEATGAGLIYQWQYYNAETKKWENTGLAGNKTPTLTVSVLANRSGMKYHCIVKDANGTKLTSAAVTLNVLPKIVTQPQSVSAAAGSTAKFTVEATGIGLTYQWQYYNTSTKKWENTGLAGNKTATLSVTAISSRNGMKYHCIVKDSAGNKLTSTAATLTIK